MWSEFERWWSDFKAAREGARFLLVFVAFVVWLIWISV